MPQVLTTSAIVTCPHGQQGISTPATPFWDAQGGLVLAEGDVGAIPSCVAYPPCLGYTLRSMGLNATQLAGRKVILATDFQQTFTGLPLTIGESHNTWDDSTPASLPADGSAPTLAPELLDVARPVVSALPAAAAFSLTSMSPSTVTVRFTSFAAFPLRFMLTLLNEVSGLNVDATSGLPGLVVAPPGGAWTTPSLAVTVTLSTPLFVALGPGLHHLYLTAISKRGLSGYTALSIMVTP